MSVHDVLQMLRLHVSVPQCDVFGYLSIDHELVILIAPVDQHPTPLQVTHTHTLTPGLIGLYLEMKTKTKKTKKTPAMILALLMSAC